MAVGAFGSFLFGKVGGRWQTFYEVERSETSRFEDHPVWLNKPVTEKGGPGLILIGIKLELNAAWCGDPRPIIEQLRTYHRSQVAGCLLLGGKAAGPRKSLFVLESISDTVTRWFRDGTPLKVMLDLSFKEYAN